MKNKKNIDKLFKESFQSFEATPSSEVWDNIQNSLDKEKRKRKPIPLWMKYGGVAALLAVFFTVGNLLFSPGEPYPNSITDIEVVKPVEEVKENEKNQHSESEPQLATEQETIENHSLREDSSPENPKKSKANTEDIVKSDGLPTYTYYNEDVISSSERNRDKNRGSDQENKYNHKGIAVTKPVIPTVAEEKSLDREKEVSKQILQPNEEVVKNTNQKIAQANESDKTLKTIAGLEITEKDDNKKSLLDAIAENERVNDDILEEENQKPEHRWNIAPNVAPVYYNGFGNGSSIDSDFSANPQKGEVNMSYGLQVSYALGERLSVRSGINNVDLSYSTSGIVIGTGPVAMGLGSVDYGSKDVVVTVFNRNTLINGFPAPGEFGQVTLKSTGGDARLIQNINYYEVPLELKYSVINTRLGVNIIGGVSTLFLGNNEISVTSNSFSSVLGSANNLSDVSFSTNIGLGLDYKLSKRFVFNVEPMLKYQLNPYTDSSVNFKPYYLGVYSGLSFKF